MAEDDNVKDDEEKVRKIVDEMNEKLIGQVKGRPYLLVVSTLYEVSREGDKSKVGAQWNWRSNIKSEAAGRSKDDIETGQTLMKLLVDQLKDVAERPGIGIRDKYGLK